MVRFASSDACYAGSIACYATPDACYAGDTACYAIPDVCYAVDIAYCARCGACYANTPPLVAYRAIAKGASSINNYILYATSAPG